MWAFIKGRDRYWVDFCYDGLDPPYLFLPGGLWPAHRFLCNFISSLNILLLDLESVRLIIAFTRYGKAFKFRISHIWFSQVLITWNVSAIVRVAFSMWSQTLCAVCDSVRLSTRVILRTVLVITFWSCVESIILLQYNWSLSDYLRSTSTFCEEWPTHKSLVASVF